METHFTATGLVLSPDNNKALMIFHKKLQLWLPAGGHIDDGELPHETVVREIFEETGLKAKIINAAEEITVDNIRESQVPSPRWILQEFIPAYKDKDAHYHYDFLYHLQAESLDLNPAEQEIEDIGWFSLDELLASNTTNATKDMYRILFTAY